uniref:Uncharacterized protein n=1 Tax=Sphaerodactylus townsendi TaxID=933632 RepID=A0ACB8EZB7_9SAUR
MASSKLSVSLGKAVFHCNKDSVKQQLRSIYLGTRRQKALKPTHPSTQVLCNQWEKNKTQRENTKTDASCPMGSEFLRSKYPNTIPHGLTSLMYKINKLVLVSEAEAVPPCTPVAFPHCPQLQQQPPPLTSSLPAAALQGRETSTEEWHVAQVSTPNWSLQGATGNMPRAPPTGSTEPRPSSAKDLCRKALIKTLGEDNQSGDSSQEEDTSESMLEANASGKGGMTHTRNATAMPTFRSISSKESVNAEVPLNVCSNTTQCLAEERQWEPFPVDFSQPSTREEKIPGTLVHCSSGEKRQAYSFVPADSKKYKPMSVDAWQASGTEISLLD